MKLSERLLIIASLIDNDAFVIDVGADHGLLEKYLLDSKKVRKIIAVENKIGPYTILSNNLIGYNVDIYLSDGIEKITKDVDTIVIAGMGGRLISTILNSGKSKLSNVNTIIVDAHTDIELVRKEICKLGFYIEREKIVFENKKYYFVIKFKKGHFNYSDFEYEFGVNITKDPLFLKYKKDQIKKLEAIIKFDNSGETLKKLERIEKI